MSIRLRLTLWYSVILAITLFFFSALLYTVFDRTLRLDVDASLEERADDITRAVRVRGDISFFPRRVTLPRTEAFAAPTLYVQLVDLNGQVAERSESLADASLPVDATILESARAGEATHTTMEIRGRHVRLYTAPVVMGETVVGIVQVGRSLEVTEATLGRLRSIMLGSSLVILIITGGAGWLLAHTALRPIDRITHEAHEIGQAQHLSRRLKLHPHPDEIGRLVHTFNDMLERIELSFAAQRRFVSDASHELRTPLTTIRGNIEMLRRNGHLDPLDREESLGDIASETDRMARLLNGLLALARADAGRHIELSSVNVTQVASEAFRQMQIVAADKVIELRFLDGGLPHAATQSRGNADSLKELFLILLDNAIKYTPPGGSVDVRVGRKGRWITVGVTDTGMGIAAEDLPRIFDRFYRSASARTQDGTGLGLAIARWIVDEHSGRISVESTPGKGTSFAVCLPV
ncbi:MAG: HAMP domain-containing histidine kinase [Chloroflexi bacterium]|nr:HAMP domain-containing histidine kinase [Chloroflexota bacterium]